MFTLLTFKTVTSHLTRNLQFIQVSQFPSQIQVSKKQSKDGVIRQITTVNLQL